MDVSRAIGLPLRWPLTVGEIIAQSPEKELHRQLFYLHLGLGLIFLRDKNLDRFPGPSPSIPVIHSLKTKNVKALRFPASCRGHVE